MPAMTNTGPVAYLRKAHQLAVNKNYSKAIHLYRELSTSHPELADVSHAMIEACTAVYRRQYLGEDCQHRPDPELQHSGALPTQARSLHPLGRSPAASIAADSVGETGALLGGEGIELQRDRELLRRINIDAIAVDPAHPAISNALIPHAQARLGMAIDTAELNSELGMIRIRGWLVDPQQSLNQISIALPSAFAEGTVSSIRRSHREDLRGLVQNLDISAHDCDRTVANAGYEIILFVNCQHDLSQADIKGIGATQINITLASDTGSVQLGKQLSHHGDAVEAAKLMIDQLIGGDMELLDLHGISELSERWSARATRLLAEPGQHRRHGLLDRTPDLSVVVPLYGRIDFMEYQLNWFNSWYRRLGDQSPAIQLIYVLDDPRLKQAFKDLARRCSILYRMPFEVVINPHNLGFAGAINAGSARAEAEWLLLLNSDVIPAADDSFEKMLRASQQHEDSIGALGARLLFENGDIQHIGMEFEKRPELDGVLGRVWLNDHPMKGLAVPMDPEQSQALVEVEAATAACLMLRTDRFRALHGLSSQYIVGDFEDSDLCMKLREQGFGIYVDPSASFYHLERQSVGSGDQRHQLKAKLVAANAITHHRLWNHTIENLKAAPAKSRKP
jgi:GT2 family glycosyltransferase